jgi:N-acetylglucosamine-6-phosphate deacetylase
MDLFGRRYYDAEPVRLRIESGKISQVTPWLCEPDPGRSWPWIAPGLFDIQVNGYGGQEFSSPRLTVEKVAAIVHAYDAFGVTRSCPTLFSETFEVLHHSLKVIATACESRPDVARRVAGIHLEGPYLSKEDGPRGAHAAAHCRSPDWEEFQRLQEASGGRVRMLTMSVEFEQSPAFIRRVAAAGVIVAIGHTSCDSAHIQAAVDAGATISTHLGNGCHVTMPIFPNYIWDQLAEDRLAASLIADGYHLPPDVFKTFVRVKTPERCILISDMSGFAGCPPGRYRAGHGDLEILPNGSLVVLGQRELLAGASGPIGTGVVNAMYWAGLDLEKAIRMATIQPAQLLGLEPHGLQPEEPADLVLFDLLPPVIGEGPPRFGVRSTVVGGEVAWGTPWHP